MVLDDQSERKPVEGVVLHYLAKFSTLYGLNVGSYRKNIVAYVRINSKRLELAAICGDTTPRLAMSP